MLLLLLKEQQTSSGGLFLELHLLLFFGEWVVLFTPSHWNWNLGIEQDRRLGLGYYQLCMVGRNWTRRNIISAVLLLFRQKWRMAINRSAEAMTIFL